ncbi:hypothetical protein LSTR_LSTR012694 [Laodelphax striatellus]|uniref:Ras-GEF domain-containing protein n=1 Tax=Laodelphax striatellus TaxID=195883 RepID=A0A482XBI5_LAOST|nr:hypothetical protein LSTR_LSTR012694 [Laodelphax striatellus]
MSGGGGAGGDSTPPKNGSGGRGGCADGDASECLLRTPTKRHLLARTPTADSIKKNLPPPPQTATVVTATAVGYDNLGASAGSGGGGGSSKSLPSNASLGGAGVALAQQAVLEALRVPPEDFASQLTLLDAACFQLIAPDELISCAWNKKNKLTVAPNVVAFTRRFNHVCFWTVQEVLTGTTPKHRAEIMNHFIRIGKKLYELNNFHSLFAIISGLQSASIYRLSKSWSHLSKKDKQSFDKLAEVFSDTANWQNLREHMESLRLPCIPYLGVFLTDLVYIDMAHPNPSSGGGEPTQRQHKMNNILRIIANLQQSRYPQLATLPHIQRYLGSIRYIEELQKFVEDDQYKLSLKLEPPSPVPSSSSSKESVGTDGGGGGGVGGGGVLSASLNLSPAKCGGGGGCGGGSRAASLRHHLQPGAVAKFVPGHRKCRSLGTKFRSTSLPRNFHKQGETVPTVPIANQTKCLGVFTKTQPRHLLDDSVMEEETQQHNSSLPHAHSLTPLTRRQTLGALDLQGEVEEAITLQGCLRRKTLLKDGKKPAVTSWQRYWVQLWATALVFYLPKSFKGCGVGALSERSNFKREPCKLAPMTGCLVTLTDNPTQPDVFLIRDPHRCNLYKFRAASPESAVEWYEALSGVLGTEQEKSANTNLISFE